MKIKYLLFLVALMISAVAISQGYADSAKINYTKEIDNYRRGINIKLLYGESTPLTAEQQKNFKGLNYFAPDIQCRVEGKLVKAGKQEDVVMKTSGDRTPIYVKYGTLNFTLNGKTLTLTVYQSKKMLEMVKEVNTLFIPFRDETCGKESYGGGRYIDCEIPATGDKVMLDFNKAYNPYCAYNPTYSCVIPPEENLLAVRIEAGEKVFEEH
jgi:uncharacterized protein (DUF1684 family)